MSMEVDIPSPLSALLKAIASPGLVLCIGAGGGSDLRHLLASRAREIVLVEPNARLADGLQRVGAGDPRVRICPVAIDADSGQAVFYRTNFPLLSSLRRPSQNLMRLFSDLQIVSEEVVQTVNLAELAAGLPFDGADNVLILDAPGNEFLILEAIVRHKEAFRFDHLIIRCGQHALYEGARSFGALEAMLRDGGYWSKWLYREEDGFVDAWITLQPAFDLADEDDYRSKATIQALDDLRLELDEKTESLHALQARLDEVGVQLRQKDETHAATFLADADLQARVGDLELALAEVTSARTRSEARCREVEGQLLDREASLRAEADRAEQLQARVAQVEGQLLDREASLRRENGRAEQLQARTAELEAAYAERVGAHDVVQQRLSEAENKLNEMKHKEWLAGKEFSRFEGQVEILKDLLFRDTVL